MKNLILTLFAVIGTFAFAQTSTTTFPAPSAITDSDQIKPHVGVRLGVADSDSGYRGAAEIGVEAGYQPYIPFGAAVEITNFTAGNSNDGVGDLNRTKVLLRGTYNFGGEREIIRHSYLGLGIGPVFDTVSGSSDTRLGTDLVAGMDFPLTASGSVGRKTFSLGATANYLFVSASGADTFGVNGLVKYWF